MVPNPLYQALVERLEALLPPRVVSLLLREGMSAEDSDPERLELATVESILKGAVFRQLQTSRPAEQAREELSEVLASLSSVPVNRGRGQGLSASAGGTAVIPAPPATETADSEASRRHEVMSPALTERLDGLHQSLRPLNLYFSWAEVQKLRAQLHLIEQEADRGEDPTALIEEAEQQLVLAHQKLEDQLVLQARELADLEEALERVTPLGGSRIRRLESLVATVRENQAQRMVAEAEVQRAQKLARDLRKLVESTVLDDGEAPPDLGRGDGRRKSPTQAPAAEHDPAEALLHVNFDELDGEDELRLDPAMLSPEASQRLLALDIDGERQELEALTARHAELLRQAPELAEEVAKVQAGHGAGHPAAEALPQLAGALAEAETSRREMLRREFEALKVELEGFPDEVDVTSPRRALSVALDLLNETLPPQEDILAIRELHAHAAERAAAVAKSAAQLAVRQAEQRLQRHELIDRLESAWTRASEVPRLEKARTTLRRALDALTHSDHAEAVDPQAMEAARDAEAAWERALAEASDDRGERRRARARELAGRLAQVPDLPALRARSTSLRDEALALQDQSELSDAHLRTMASMIDQFMADAKAAFAGRLDQLAREAGDPVAPGLLRALQDAARALDEGTFPDLAEVEAQLGSARDERLSDLRQRYQRARQEVRRLETAEVEAAATLVEAVDRAREALEGPEGEAMVAELERRLQTVQDQVAERLAGFEPRLDTALQTFKTVSRLNNDDVAAVRRVLNHLDSQRDAVERVSIGLQARLFASLAEAEERLEGLSAAFEATRAIADQLVGSNQLDDLLGGWDALFGDDDKDG